ncbi:MAG TPA: hypothetical protein VIV11_13655 [Kofleriaceae bacterium]
MTKHAWIVAVVFAIGCKSKSESPPPPPSPSPTPATAPPTTPLKPAPIVAGAVEDRAAAAIKGYFEILAAFTKAFKDGSECDDKRQRVTATLADATKKRDEVVALFRDLEVAKRAGPTMVRPSEDDPNYDVRMHAFAIGIDGTKASCNLDADLNTFLEPIWKAAHDAGWKYDPEERQRELLKNKQ